MDSDCITPNTVCTAGTCKAPSADLAAGNDTSTTPPPATPVAQGGACTVDTDCETGLSCVDGACNTPPSTPAAEGGSCTVNTDCETGLSCSNGVCNKRTCLFVCLFVIIIVKRTFFLYAVLYNYDENINKMYCMPRYILPTLQNLYRPAAHVLLTAIVKMEYFA